MVSNSTEEPNESDQSSTTKSKQRKTTPTGRKSKSVINAVSSLKDGSPSKIPAENATQIDSESTNMGNASAPHSGNDINEHAEAKQEASAVQLNHNRDKTSNNGLARASLPEDSTIEQEIENLNRESCNVQNSSAEIARLKRLLLLQVSLITRQQDLLRLRDREIMQLKASNSNYKCQLNRVRRRMTKRKSDGQEESPKSRKRKSSESYGDNTPQKTKEVSLVHTETQTTTAMSVPEVDTRPITKQRRLEYHEAVKESVPSTSHVENSREDAPGPSRRSSGSENKNNNIPVPISSADRVQNQLLQELMISPPDKALETFCKITSSYPELDEFPFKICDRCPHCVAFAQEITRLFKTAGISRPTDSLDLDCTQDEKDIMELTGITSYGCDFSCDDTEPSRKVPIMRTSTSYHRIAPTFDQNHWRWDLDCGDIIRDKALKLPTWKVQEITPSMVKEEELTEMTDDQPYLKRHEKLELDEKKRKRWDIQGIREYRYNEKLRQKMMKQGAMQSPNIESFSGLLHDAESVEVDDSLPVNVFGYPMPHLNLEEFSLSRMRDVGRTSNISKRRAKKL